MVMTELQSLLNLLQKMGVTRYRQGDLEIELAPESVQIAPQPVFAEPSAPPAQPGTDLYTELLGGRTRFPGDRK